MSDKAVITCALTGVLTDPAQHPVPVTPEQMAREAKAAFDAGAAIMHVHFRQQAPGKGHLPSWEPQLASTVMLAIRDACPGVILNESTGTIVPDISGPLACLRAVKPEIAACNAGSLRARLVPETTSATSARSACSTGTAAPGWAAYGGGGSPHWSGTGVSSP